MWFENSVRGAAALTIAVYVAQRASLQHAFWVVLGTLSVLRSNALGTGATIIQAVAGTAVGIVAGGLLVSAIGVDHGSLWALLPFAVFLAAYAPRAIRFAAGQAGFTVALVVLFNIIQPIGWKVGLVRVEDVAIGFAISLLVGLLFWPRGARAELRESVADAYATSADYLAAATTSGDTAAARRTVRRRDAQAGRHLSPVPGRARTRARRHGQRRHPRGGRDASSPSRLLADDDGGRHGPWTPSAALEREANALGAWYLRLAGAIRRIEPAPRPRTRERRRYRRRAAAPRRRGPGRRHEPHPGRARRRARERAHQESA